MVLVAGPVWADVLTPDNPNITYSSYAHLTLSSTMARFDRIISNALKYDNPGARVRFRTDATSVVASVFYNSMASQVVCSIGTILVDGTQTGTYTVGGTRGTVSFTVLTQGTAAFHTIELVLPYWDSVDFTGLTVNAGANFTAPPAPPSVRWVSYGDSITQGGYAAVNPFIEQVGRTRGWETVNMGFGGYTIQPADGTTLGGLGATVITEMMGHNNAGSGTPVATFIASMTSWVSAVRSMQPSVPIYLISPIYTSNTYSALLASYGPALQSLVTASGDPNLHYIDGASLGINAGNSHSYLADGVHPNDAGAAVIASNLAPQISTTSVAIPGSSFKVTRSVVAFGDNASQFMSDIKTTDLINQGQATYLSGSMNVSGSNGTVFDSLRDGAGSTSDLSKVLFLNGTVSYPATMDFNLNLNPTTGGNANGYDISALQVIAGWSNTCNFCNQSFALYVKPVVSSTFVQVGGAIVNDGGSTVCATETILTDTNGIVASGVATVRLVFNIPPSGVTALVLQDIDVSGSATTNYQAWRNGAFATYAQRTDPTISSELNTPANDGITNLMKYALLIDPMTNGKANLPTSSQQSGYLTLTYRQNKLATDLTYTVQVSDTLTGNNWSPATTVLSQADAGSYWLVTVRDNVTMAGHQTRFIRLKVSH